MGHDASPRRRSCRASALLVMLLTTSGLVVGCGDAQPPATWQLSGLYLDPSRPGALPAPAAGAVTLGFGTGTLRGDTGCAVLSAPLDYGDGPADLAEADSLTIGLPELADARDCPGATREVQDTLVELLPGRWRINRPAEDTLILTAAEGGLDRPAIHLVTLRPR